MDNTNELGTNFFVVSSDMNFSLLDRLLEMAQQYQREGNLRQAEDICWKLLNDNEGTIQADTAKAMLLGLADNYMRVNERHVARSIYEQLMTLNN